MILKHITWRMVPSFYMTVQKVPYPAPLCPKILAGALVREIQNEPGTVFSSYKTACAPCVRIGYETTYRAL